MQIHGSGDRGTHLRVAFDGGFGTPSSTRPATQQGRNVADSENALFQARVNLTIWVQLACGHTNELGSHQLGGRGEGGVKRRQALGDEDDVGDGKDSGAEILGHSRGLPRLEVCKDTVRNPPWL